jgi:putative MATE family efflux protein
LFHDKQFLIRLFRTASPIILQNLFISLINLINGIMIGQLGDTSVAAQGLAGQINFVLTILMFGISTGGSIFVAQFWGSRSIHKIRKVMGVTLSIALLAATLVTLLCLFFPEAILHIYSNDELVISLGSQYLRLMAPSFMMLAVVYVFSSALRSTGNVILPMVISTISLGVDAGLAYGFIFGKLGLPNLGIMGGALAISISQTSAAVLLLWQIYLRKSPVAATLNEMFAYDWVFVRKVLQRAIPVAGNELFWGLGITIYNIIYAHISTESIAAYNIMINVDNLAFVFFLGISDACAIIVGNTIGEGREDLSFKYAWRIIRISFVSALVMGGLILIVGPQILSIYKVSSDVEGFTRNLILMEAAFFWARATNLVTFVGTFRSGGDTRFAYIADVGSLWGIGIPLAAAGAFIFHLPVYTVYLLAMADECFKFIVSQIRFHSKKWIHNLVHVM